MLIIAQTIPADSALWLTALWQLWCAVMLFLAAGGLFVAVAREGRKGRR